MTPKGQAEMQDEQPLQMSGWMKTFSNSLWMMAPVGHACWQGAVTQCLQTSLIINQRPSFGSWSSRSSEKAGEGSGGPSESARGAASMGAPRCPMNFTWRQEVAESAPVLS